ncbi:MAG: HAMP domain-containing protein [Chloroflexi bacterium]|nr:HAMP domain-containing protein [Chloroflexota bacterium]
MNLRHAAAFRTPLPAWFAHASPGKALNNLLYMVGIGARYVVLALGLVLCTTLFVGLIALNRIDSMVQATTQARLGVARASFASFFDERQGRLEHLAQWLARDSAFAGVEMGKPPDALAAQLSLLAAGGADFVGQRSGEQLRIIPERLAPLVAPAIREMPADRSPSVGDVHSGGARGEDGSLVWLSESRLPNGDTLFAGYLLSQAFADQFNARTGLDLTLFAERRPVATSLVDAQGNRALGAIHNAATLCTVQARGIGLRDSFFLSSEEFSADYFPLPDQGGRSLGIYAVSLPVPKLWVNGLSLGGWSYGLLLGLIGVAVAAGVLLATRVVVPLRSLLRAITRIEKGDFTTSVETTTTAEVRPLVREVEEMRRSVLKAVNQLAIEKSVYQGTFQAMADGVFTTNQAGVMTSVNPALLADLPENALDIEGSKCCGTSVLKDASGRSLCTLACTWLWLKGRSEPAVVKGYFDRPDGQTRAVEMIVTPIKDRQEQTVGLVHVLRDISVQEELQRMKERFLMSVSHELRTPLSSLASSVEFLRDQSWDCAEPDRQRLLETVQRSSRRLQSLTTNLLDLGSIQTGSFTVKPDSISLDGPLQEAIPRIFIGRGLRTTRSRWRAQSRPTCSGPPPVAGPDGRAAAAPPHLPGASPPGPRSPAHPAPPGTPLPPGPRSPRSLAQSTPPAPHTPALRAA